MCWYDFKVFWASKEKGWGIRTLKDLPTSAFIFKFVGEISTNAKLMQQIQGCMRNGESAYKCINNHDLFFNKNWVILWLFENLR